MKRDDSLRYMSAACAGGVIMSILTFQYSVAHTASLALFVFGFVVCRSMISRDG